MSTTKYSEKHRVSVLYIKVRTVQIFYSGQILKQLPSFQAEDTMFQIDKRIFTLNSPGLGKRLEEVKMEVSEGGP